MKNKNKLLKIIIVVIGLLISYFFAKKKIGIPITSEDFPLEQQWDTKLGSIQELSASENKEIIFARTNNSLYGIEAKNGEVLWRQPLYWQGDFDAAVPAADMVFVADGKRILAIKETDGSVLWETPVSQTDFHVKDATQDFVAVINSGDMYIYDATRGELLWRQTICRNFVTPYIYKNTIYTSCYKLRAFDAFTGDEIWERKNNRISTGYFDDGIIYYHPNQADELVAFDLETQTEL